MAPVAAANTAPECRSRGTAGRAVPRASRALIPVPVQRRGLQVPAVVGGEDQRITALPTYFARCASMAGMMCGGMSTSRMPASLLGVVML